MFELSKLVIIYNILGLCLCYGTCDKDDEAASRPQPLEISIYGFPATVLFNATVNTDIYRRLGHPALSSVRDWLSIKTYASSVVHGFTEHAESFKIKTNKITKEGYPLSPRTDEDRWLVGPLPSANLLLGLWANVRFVVFLFNLVHIKKNSSTSTSTM